MTEDIKKGFWSKLTKLQKRLIIIASILASLSAIYPFANWMVGRLLHKEIQEYETLKIDLQRALKKSEAIEKQLNERSVELQKWADDVEYRLELEQKYHNATHQVGLRSDSNGLMYYQDRYGDQFPVHPDLEFSTQQWSYWYYIDKNHKKRYIFNERF